MEDGVVKAKHMTGVRITDLERTVIDSIHDYKKIGGLEELMYCLEGVHYLDETKLVSRLYHIKMLAPIEIYGSMIHFRNEKMILSYRPQRNLSKSISQI